MVGDFFADVDAFASEESFDAALPPTPNKLKVGDFFAGASAAEDFLESTPESGDTPMPKRESVGDRCADDGFTTALVLADDLFDFLFDAALTTLDFGAPPTPMIESVGDLDEAVVGDGFFALVVEGDILGALEKMLSVGERFVV